jgi:large subunit ribosomal protein L31
MKDAIHPKYTKTTIICNTCKTEYVLGSTEDGIKVELCSNCHPFYTGKETLVDTDNLVDKFNKKRLEAQNNKSLQSKKEKRLKRKQSTTQAGTTTLKDMLAQIK